MGGVDIYNDPACRNWVDIYVSDDDEKQVVIFEYGTDDPGVLHIDKSMVGGFIKELASVADVDLDIKYEGLRTAIWRKIWDEKVRLEMGLKLGQIDRAIYDARMDEIKFFSELMVSDIL